MTPDEPDSDRILIQPPASGGGAASSDKTQVHAPAPAPTPAPPPPAAAVHVPPPAPDMGNGLAVGTRLGEFELIKLLGEGGFGIVYLATDHSLQRRVALKARKPHPERGAAA